MEYTMEELVPIVARLAEKYTAFESTSVTYEKAEQLMEAVLYCIHEIGFSEEEAVILAERIPARQAYETGLECVKRKVKRALDLYNEILTEVIWHEDQNLYDIFAKDMPEFFRRYDVKFEPQNTIIMLDYPVSKDLSRYTGIDKIYEFLVCICQEHGLGRMPESDDSLT
ncbi:DUF6179 domain-containing protein [Lachnospiraceae bacterium 46-15]